jgi:hypothetical protein
MAKKYFLSNSILPNIPVGTGMHDSSSALIPYLVNFSEPFCFNIYGHMVHYHLTHLMELINKE